ncbi:MAG: hypothetical protein ACRDNW_07560 [Trebonia sp.]
MLRSADRPTSPTRSASWRSRRPRAWGRPTALVVILLVILLLVVLGLIELIGRPPAGPQIAGQP